MGQLSSWSSGGLIAHLRELYDLIYVSECFGVNDLVLYHAIINELSRRGFMTKKLQAENYYL